MCFKANAFTHTMTSYMRRKRRERNDGGGGRQKSKNTDEHRWQRKRIVVRRKRESYIAGRKHLKLKRRRKSINGRKIDERAGQNRRVHCTRRIDGEEA